MLEKSAADNNKNGDDEDDDHDDDENEGGSENIDYLVNFFSKNHKGVKDNRLYSWHTISLNKRQVKEQTISNAK